MGKISIYRESNQLKKGKLKPAFTNTGATFKHRNYRYVSEMSNSILELKQKNKIFNSAWLKTYEGFEDYSEEDAEKTVEQLRSIANIVCDHVQKASI